MKFANIVFCVVQFDIEEKNMNYFELRLPPRKRIVGRCSLSGSRLFFDKILVAIGHLCDDRGVFLLKSGLGLERTAHFLVGAEHQATKVYEGHTHAHTPRHRDLENTIMDASRAAKTDAMVLRHPSMGLTTRA